MSTQKQQLYRITREDEAPSAQPSGAVDEANEFGKWWQTPDAPEEMPVNEATWRNDCLRSWIARAALSPDCKQWQHQNNLLESAMTKMQIRHDNESPARLAESLAVDTPWPVADILELLSAAAQMLFDRYDYDADGWENIEHGIKLARKYAAGIRAALRARDGQGDTSFDSLHKEHIAWVKETFPGESVMDQIAHLKEEVGELEAVPGDPDEWADALMLILAGANNAGVDILTAFADKLKKNKARTWEKTERGYRHAPPAAETGAEKKEYPDMPNPPPDYKDLWNAFVSGAKEARLNPTATEGQFSLAADAYCKLVHSEKAPEMFAWMGQQQPPSWSRGIHNPNKLKPEQVGPDHRLLLVEEVLAGTFKGKAEMWNAQHLDGPKWDNSWWRGDDITCTYRVPASTPWPEGPTKQSGITMDPGTKIPSVTCYPFSLPHALRGDALVTRGGETLEGFVFSEYNDGYRIHSERLSIHVNKDGKFYSDGRSHPWDLFMRDPEPPATPPVPEGWELVDGGEERFIEGAKYWNGSSWQQSTARRHEGYSAGAWYSTVDGSPVIQPRAFPADMDVLEKEFFAAIKAHPECFPTLSPVYIKIRQEIDSFLKAPVPEEHTRWSDSPIHEEIRADGLEDSSNFDDAPPSPGAQSGDEPFDHILPRQPGESVMGGLKRSLAAQSVDECREAFSSWLSTNRKWTHLSEIFKAGAAWARQQASPPSGGKEQPERIDPATLRPGEEYQWRRKGDVNWSLPRPLWDFSPDLEYRRAKAPEGKEGE